MPNFGVRISDLEALSGVTGDDILLVLNKIDGSYEPQRITATALLASLSAVTDTEFATLSASVILNTTNIQSLSAELDAESLWDRNGTTLSAQNAGDNLHLEGYLGIKPADPLGGYNAGIEIVTNDTFQAIMQTEVYSDKSVAFPWVGPTIIHAVARGTHDIPTYVIDDDWMSSLSVFTNGANTAEMIVKAVGDHGLGSNFGSKFEYWATPSGTTSPVKSLEITGDGINVPGQIISRSIIPETTDIYSLGTSALLWKDLYVTSGSIYFDNQKLTIDPTGQIFINDVLFESGTDFTSVSGYSANARQAFTQVSGVNVWKNITPANLSFATISNVNYLSGEIDALSGVTDLTTVSGYNDITRQVLMQISGTNFWQDTTAANNIYLTLSQFSEVSGNGIDILGYGPTSGALTINLSGDGIYEYTLSGDASFTAINSLAGKSYYSSSLITAGTNVASVSASFDPTWYWVGTRPTDEGTSITSGNMIELVLRSSGTKIIAAYEDLV